MSRFLATLILLTFYGIGNAQEFEPLELVQKVFKDKKFARKTNRYSTREYKGHPNANDLPTNTKLKFQLLDKSENTAVINITILDTLGKGIDTYAHLEKGKKWKINALRALAMTGFMEQAMLEMEKMTEEQIDTLIQKDDGTFKSKEDFYRKLENIKLTLALDHTIIEHFEKRREKFEELRNELQNTEFNKEEQSYRKINLGDQIKTDYKRLLINSISTSISCENCFEFIIGGMIDNTVGFFYIPNKQDVPKMNPSRIIMIKEIGNGWYLFKTT
ncbi:hypothetical protein SAMN04487910_2743 [Aquimarina amphilecti]|uniref:Uncharacterized protein n=1 Tax=Aquimarina amphilecti TaxID=1038014 RepID=A0A1H7R0E6_AQUAM|nr:hypothetical protein [Aquimarina amphilecti]SEL53394.1 hypothetical protein SAMN04487910_2743 [Aquimarina amphilecti]